MNSNDVYRLANTKFLEFTECQRDIIFKQQPILLLLLKDTIMMYRYGEYVDDFELDLDQYNNIKSIVHYCLLHPNNTNEEDTQKICDYIDRDKKDFNFSNVSYYKNLQKCLRNNEKLDQDIIRLSMKHCAILYQQTLHNTVQQIKSMCNEQEWNTILIIVTGPPSPRPGHSAMQYFHRLVGSTTEKNIDCFRPDINASEKQRKSERKLYYVENVDNHYDAFRIVMQQELERRNFDVIVDMNTDILAFDTKEYLKKVCNK